MASIGWAHLDLEIGLHHDPLLTEQHAAVRRLVAGYDVLILVRDVTATSYLEGRLLTRWYAAAVR